MCVFQLCNNVRCFHECPARLRKYGRCQHKGQGEVRLRGVQTSEHRQLMRRKQSGLPVCQWLWLSLRSQSGVGRPARPQFEGRQTEGWTDKHLLAHRQLIPLDGFLSCRCRLTKRLITVNELITADQSGSRAIFKRQSRSLWSLTTTTSGSSTQLQCLLVRSDTAAMFRSAVWSIFPTMISVSELSRKEEGPYTPSSSAFLFFPVFS